MTTPVAAGPSSAAPPCSSLVIIAVIVASIVGDGEDALPPRQPGPLDVQAWTPYWALDTALPDLETHADTIHQLSPFWFRTTSADKIEVEAQTPTDQAAQFIDIARRHQIPLVASILDGTKAGVMAGILADPQQRTRHVDALAKFAADGDYAGLDIDYEQFAFSDGRDSWAATRPNWVAFIDELSQRLHADGRTLTVSIPPVYDGGQTNDSGYWVYDYAAITPLVDTIRVMAYDYSVVSGGPGPIAPRSWVQGVIRSTVQVSGDASKLVLGIPLYGYNWVVGTTGTCPATAEGNISLSQRDMVALAERTGRDPAVRPGQLRDDVLLRAAGDGRRDVVHAVARGALRRRQRGPDPHAGRHRRRVPGRLAVRPRLRGRPGVERHRHRRRPGRPDGFGPDDDRRRRLSGQDEAMKVHLVDGTYELFRQNFGRLAKETDPGPFAATVGVLRSTLQLFADGATHVGVASDHVIESFRNSMWKGYKTSAGMPPELLAQIPIVEQALEAMGVTTWAMVEVEADDALGAAAAVADADERVEQVLIVTPDKDLGQCVRGDRVVQYDRRKREILDEAAVTAKFGVPPASIPDYLGLVGDTADGFPGITGWGAKSASAVLARYGHLEEIPDQAGQWDVPGLRGAAKLSHALRADFELALLFRRIATIETDVEVGAVDDWRWTGRRPSSRRSPSASTSPTSPRRAAALAAKGR